MHYSTNMGLQLRSQWKTSAMKLIAHRGHWLKPEEKNSLVAFSRALDNGFGIETDLRDLNGRLVVSHDMPIEGAISIEDFGLLLRNRTIDSPIALNIKADGLVELVGDFLESSGVKNAFVFDMSVPDMRSYIKSGISVYTRLSEYENQAVFMDSCDGVWMDSFNRQWFDHDFISDLIKKSKKICFVSPELHGRNHQSFWKFLNGCRLNENENISLCTDFPLEAKEYFDV